MRKARMFTNWRYRPNMRMEVAMRMESAVASPRSKLVIELDIAGLKMIGCWLYFGYLNSDPRSIQLAPLKCWHDLYMIPIKWMCSNIGTCIPAFKVLTMNYCEMRNVNFNCHFLQLDSFRMIFELWPIEHKICVHVLRKM